MEPSKVTGVFLQLGVVLVEFQPPQPVQLLLGIVEIIAMLSELDTLFTLGQLLGTLDAAALARGTA